jgi:hypothetical protein
LYRNSHALLVSFSKYTKSYNQHPIQETVLLAASFVVFVGLAALPQSKENISSSTWERAAMTIYVNNQVSTAIRHSAMGETRVDMGPAVGWRRGTTGLLEATCRSGSLSAKVAGAEKPGTNRLKCFTANGDRHCISARR